MGHRRRVTISVNGDETVRVRALPLDTWRTGRTIWEATGAASPRCGECVHYRRRAKPTTPEALRRAKYGHCAKLDQPVHTNLRAPECFTRRR